MSRGRRLQVLGIALALAGIASMTAAPSAGADDPVAPPGWTGNGAPPGSFVGFLVSPQNVPATDRVGGSAPVTLTRETTLSGQALLDAFDNWEPRTLPDGTVQYGWPAVWAKNGVELHRVAWCDAAASQCQYTVTTGGPFYFAASTAPLDPTQVIDLSRFAIGSLTKSPPPPVVATLTYTKGGPGELGKLTLDGSGSNDPLGGTLTFRWTITSQDPNNPKIWSGEGQVLTQSITDPGTYCIDLQVVSSMDPSHPVPAGQQCITFTDGEVPAKPVNLPSGGGGGGGGATAPAPSSSPIATVSFAKPSNRAPSVFGGGPSAPTVVWLWRPDFYQPTADRQLPRTGGRPKLTGKTEILVSTEDGPAGASAGPWLGGLAAFGLIGGAFLLSRRRRMLRLEP
jgi:hypothetical protein